MRKLSAARTYQFGRAGEGEDARVESRRVVAQHRARVALRIDGDEDRLQPLCLAAKQFEHVLELQQRGRADIGAGNEAEADELEAAAKVFVRHRPALHVHQQITRHQGRGVLHRRGVSAGGGLGERRRRSSQQQREEDRRMRPWPHLTSPPRAGLRKAARPTG
jgi:hypothetical protein